MLPSVSDNGVKRRVSAASATVFTLAELNETTATSPAI